jgi:ubiquinone/menaquinone biosynthesis C-methylase UbiE
MNTHATPTVLPGEGLNPAKMPGHWILARLGKRVLRPGGMTLTRRMLDALAIGPTDHVVEFAPGMGRTARIVLETNPASYTGIERDAAATEQVRHWLTGDPATRQVINGEAQATGLADGRATAVYGEAMLTMQPQTKRRMIVAEAFRLLKPGGRYAIHELATQLDGIDAGRVKAIQRKITDAIHHQAYPMQLEDWRQFLEAEGFEVEQSFTEPMALLEPRRLIKDEGWLGAARFGLRLLTHGPERRRVLEMRRVFRELHPHLAAICLVVRKPLTSSKESS